MHVGMHVSPSFWLLIDLLLMKQYWAYGPKPTLKIDQGKRNTAFFISKKL